MDRLEEWNTTYSYEESVPRVPGAAVDHEALGEERHDGERALHHPANGSDGPDGVSGGYSALSVRHHGHEGVPE